jgi:serine protease inhibitor
MAGSGGRGQTAAQIVRTLHLRGPRDFLRMGSLQGAISAAQAAAGNGDPKAPTLEMANGLFVQQGFPLDQAFLSGLLGRFGAAPESLDFAGDPDGSVAAINAWASERTHGVIPQLLGSLPSETVLALANAVYLEASWRSPFEHRETGPGPFHNAQSTTAQFMRESETLPYGSGRGYQAVELPYRASTLSMLVVLPRKGGRVGSLLHHLDARGLGAMARHLSPRAVDLSLPRFHLNTHTSLNAALESLGMTAAFSELADFSGITATAALRIALVEHEADLSVDEEGTTAAAATAVLLEPTSKSIPRHPVTFNANRPFLFFLRDDHTGAVLFAGRVADPA